MKEELKERIESLLERELGKGEINKIDFAINYSCNVEKLDLSTEKGMMNLIVALAEELYFTNEILNCSEKNVRQLSLLLRNSGKIGLTYFKLWAEYDLEDIDRDNIIKSIGQLETKK